ncbi:MAG: hypothetical protein ACI8TX_002846 [Hyphomicrobiaceae bacterium]|jgi:hypothetical protein
MFFYFDFSTWLRMIRLAWKERNPQVRTYYLCVLLLWVPVVSSFHAICFFLDGLLFPGLLDTEIRAPIFVVGHARSGTTLVHRLMSKDRGKFSSFVLYELYFPSLLQKVVIRAIAALDERYLGSFLGRRVEAWEDKHYAGARKVHKMGLTEPEEDDIVLYYSCASGFWITKMPYMGDLDFYYVDQWPARKRRRLMRFYADCLRRQLYLAGDNKIHLSKNPVFAGRVAALIEAFPDARFVVPVRNPAETIPSLLKLMTGGWKRLGWEPQQVERCLGVLADQSFHTYRYPIEVLAAHPATAHAIVDYRDLTADPAASIAEIYRQLGLDLTLDFAEVLAAQEKRERKHVSVHRYSLEEFGLERDEIHKRLPDMVERYGWDTP